MKKVKRLNVIKVRYSDEELASLKHSAEIPLAKYIREKSLENFAWRIYPPKIDKDLIRQLAYLGNNLNQLTKLAHEKNNAGSFDSLSLAIELASIRQQLEEIREFYTATGNERESENNTDDAEVIDLEIELVES